MSRVGDLYMMSRLSYEQAMDDYHNKKTNSLLDAYKKYYKENVGMECYDPQGDLINFYDEDHSPGVYYMIEFLFWFLVAVFVIPAIFIVVSDGFK